VRAVDYLEERTKHYWQVVSQDAAFNQRTRGIAVITQQQADRMGVTGPTARASNVARDVRVDAPYAAYGLYPVEMMLDETGDLAARVLVRLRELFESYHLIRMVLTNLPAGELSVRVKRRIGEGETVSRVEAPRGDLFYFIQSGGEGPARVKVRTPTISNMGSVLHLTVGHQLADVPMILAGIDPCFSCNDRMVQIQRGGEPDAMTWEQLRRYGIDFYRRRGG
jgi:NADH-quinone oxidoreductase subunit D